MTPEREALANLLRYVERNECTHETLHRGGTIWTICDNCGRKWADDRGGFVPYSPPPEIVAARESLSAAPGEPCAVKPLEWRDHRPDSFPEPAWSAQTPFGFYNIEEVSASDSPAYVVRLHAHHFIADKDGLDEAKAAAQADYERRIRSALVTTPQPAAGWDEAITTALHVAKQNGATTHPKVKALRREAPAPADLSYVSQLIAENNELKDQLAARHDTAEARLREALDLLQLQQRGRAKALRLLDQQCEVSDPATLAQADACEECGNELKQALSTGDEAKESEGGTDGRAAEAMGTAKAALSPVLNAQSVHVDGAGTHIADGASVSPSEPSPPADRREIVALDENYKNPNKA